MKLGSRPGILEILAWGQRVHGHTSVKATGTSRKDGAQCARFFVSPKAKVRKPLLSWRITITSRKSRIEDLSLRKGWGRDARWEGVKIS